MKKLLIGLSLLATPAWADPLNFTISGDAHEKVPLETLLASTAIPDASALSFSMDGGKEAIEGEVIPLTVLQAALYAENSNLRPPLLPLIPSAPYIVQPIPPADHPTLAHFRDLGTPGQPRLAPTSWDFVVVDHDNHEISRTSSDSRPTEMLSWNGLSGDRFVLDPNETYFSYIEFKTSSGTVARIPGEAERFPAYARQDGNDQVVVFGERLYKDGSGVFSDEGRFYLRDLGQRLTRLNRHAFSTGTVTQDFSVTLYEPEPRDDGMAKRRLRSWKEYLEQALGEPVADVKISVEPSLTNHPLVKIRLKNFEDLSEPVMTGLAVEPRPQLEDKSTWIQFKTVRDMIVVEMRHDRLFRTGSAYLRDEALPLVTDALKKIREEKYRSRAELVAAAASEHSSEKEIRKLKEKQPKILLRSYMEKPRDRKRGRLQEEDPKLAALRSKVLFTLFADERFLD